MLYLACLLLAVGFYAMYKASAKMSSKKVISNKNKTRKNKWILNSLGFYLLCFGYGLFINQMSWAAGVFTASVILMTFSSLIIILAPLNLFKFN